MIDYKKAKSLKFDDVIQTYDQNDTIRYALGIGFGQDPMDKGALSYIYEKCLLAAPTMACVLATPGFWLRDNKELNVDYTKVVHGEQELLAHAPLPPAGTVIGRTRISSIVDKGTGALVCTERQIIEASSQKLLATVRQGVFCRGEGGFTKNLGARDAAPPPLPITPDRQPDGEIRLLTRPETALLYRLSGDFNPLHADPAVAAQAGFPRPILHGLATYGMACRGLLARLCNYDPARLHAIGARMSAPVFPGETLHMEYWKEQDRIHFQVRVLERDVVALSRGYAVIEFS